MPTREEWKIALDAMTTPPRTDTKAQRERWENVSDKDKRFVKKFGLAVFAVALLVVLWEAHMGPVAF